MRHPWAEAAGALLFYALLFATVYGVSLAVVWSADKAGLSLPRELLHCAAPAASSPR